MGKGKEECGEDKVKKAVITCRVRNILPLTVELGKLLLTSLYGNP